MPSFFLVFDAACTVFALYASYWLALRSHPEHPNSPTVVPAVIPWLGDAYHFAVRRTTLFARLRAKYGPVYKFIVAGRYFVVVSSPTAVNNALLTSPKILESLEVEAFEPIAGLTENLHKMVEVLQRTAYAITANTLSGDKMSAITTSMNKRLFAYLQGLSTSSEEQTISLYDYVIPNLYRATTASFFGDRHVVDIVQAFTTMDDGMYHIANYMAFMVGGAVNARERCVAAIRLYVEEALDPKNDGYVEGTSSLIFGSVQGLRKAGFSVNEISRLLLVIVWGINGNLLQITSAALAHVVSDPVFYHSVAAKVRGAVSEKFADIQDLLSSEPSAITGGEFRILDSIVQETLRLDFVGGITRKVLQDTYLKGEDDTVYHLRKGEILFVDVRGMHHDEAYYPQPKTFIPDRFVSQQAGTDSSGMKQFRPFGGGVFNCKGQEYARYAIKMFLMQTFLLFDVEVASNAPTPSSKEVNIAPMVTRFRKVPLLRLQRRVV